MIGNFGYGEMILIGFLILLLFGAKRLPEIGSSLGKSIRMFKNSVKDIQDELPNEKDFDEEPPRQRQYSQQSQQTQQPQSQVSQESGGQSQGSGEASKEKTED